MAEENNQARADQGPQFEIHRIYLKDVSLETPNSPEIFTDELKPEINMQLNSMVKPVGSDMYEVVLNVTVTAKKEEKTAFLAEVQQAGLFTVKGFPEEQKGMMLGAYCQTTLYPFARETVSDLVVKGGFAPLLLMPINFDALYAQSIDQSQAQAKAP